MLLSFCAICPNILVPPVLRKKVSLPVNAIKKTIHVLL